MSIVQSSLQSSEQRPIGLRTRSDLESHESAYQGERCWIIKDPLSLKYFRLREPEHLILQELRGTTSYRALRSLLAKNYPDSRVEIESVQRLVAHLHQNGLLISSSQNQSIPLDRKKQKENWQRAIGLLSSLTSIRFPGYSPDRLLNFLYPLCRFFFTGWFTVLVAATCIAAGVLILTNFQQFMAKLPEFELFFAFDNLVLMSVILIVTKTIHELGHGLMCRHFGGECHQIGFMLLLLTPAMYCDTSDSWILRNRWQRMAIGAAGMYVEIFLASICAFVWWFTHPGWVHYIALNILFLSSVSTIVFNANPLLKYDGYFMLADFWEIPNLAQKARIAMLSKLRVWTLGMKPIPMQQVQRGNEKLLVSYGVGAVCYRWFVTLSILWLVRKVLEPHGLVALADLFILATLFGMVVVPVYQMIKFFSFPGRLREMKMRRMWISGAAVALLVAFVCLFPLPHYVWATFVIRPQEAQQLVVAQGGQLKEVHAREGDQMRTGDVVAVLQNDELTIHLNELEGRLASLKLEKSAYEFVSSVQLDSARKLAETLAAIRSTERQIELKQQQVDNLTIRATRSGEIFAPHNRLQESFSELELASWTDTPLDQHNQSAYIEANTSLGMIGNAKQMEAILVIDQSDIKLVEPGQRVVALVRQASGEFIEAKISRVAQDELSVVPRELSQTNHGPVAVKPGQAGLEQPLAKSYEAYAAIPSEEVESGRLRLLPGMRGEAKIEVGHSTIAQRFIRYLGSLIHFR